MKHALLRATALATLVWALPAAAQVTLYENPDYGGRAFSTPEAVANLKEFGFNDRASSLVISSGRWELCDDAGYGGRCVTLPAGRYASLSALGLGDRVSSLRPAAPQGRGDDEDRRGGDFRRRGGERLYEAQVTSVHAVVGPPQQRCWVERQQVDGDRGANVPGALAGALLGGILGHQIGGGTGKDIATAGGVVAGAAVGAQVGRGAPNTQDVQRCAAIPGSANPAYWDVTYTFRGQPHRMQTTTPPGRVVMVNRQGEPRT
jgi:uncharacterized protein YcfJ